MKKLFTLLMALFLLAPGLCFADGPYIVDMAASYRHPLTGAMEDSGKNEGIGQGMAEGVLHPQALYEEIGGKRYLTLRLHMMDNISKVGIAVQKKGGSGFTGVGYESPQGSGEWKDFRFQLPGKDCIIRLNLFIDAMGRDVVFYGDMGQMTAGNTDFVASAKAASVQTKKAPPAKSTQSPKPKVDSAAPVQAASSAPGTTASATSSLGNTAADTKPEDRDGDTITHGGESGLGDTESDIGYEHGLLTEDSPEIQEMEKGEKGKDEQQEAPKKKAPWGPATRIMFASFMAVIVFLTCASLTVGAVFYFLAKKKRMLNELREEDEDEDFSFEDF